MSVEQRSEHKKLVESAKEKEIAEGGDFLFRVRGPPENLRIIKFRKTIRT